MEKEKQSIIVSRLFGILIKRKREELKYSKEELSLILHIKPSLLEKWELGKNQIPKDKLTTLASVLGISSNEIDLIYKAPSKDTSNRYNFLYRRSFIINLIAINLIVLSATIILTALIFINIVNDIPRGRILVFTLFSDQYSYYFFMGIARRIMLLSFVLILLNVIIEIISMMKRCHSSKNENNKGVYKSICLLLLLTSIGASQFSFVEKKESNRDNYIMKLACDDLNDNEEAFDLFYSLEMEECWYECAQSYTCKSPFLFAIRQQAKLLSTSYYGDTSTLDNDGDSFRTLYISAMINYQFGEKFFERFLSNFKTYRGSDLCQLNRQTMDIYNAKSGKRIAEEFKKYQDKLSGTLYLDMAEFCSYVVSQGEKYQIYKLNEDCSSFTYTTIGKDNPIFK